MDEYIAQICKEAERKLRARTSVTEQELAACRDQNAQLSERAQVLEQRIQSLEATIQQQQCGPDVIQHGLLAKYERLKENYEGIQVRYRKERNIWKKWIEYFQREEERSRHADVRTDDKHSIAQKADNEVQAMSLLDVSPNLGSPSTTNTDAVDKLNSTGKISSNVFNTPRNQTMENHKEPTQDQGPDHPTDSFQVPSSSQDAGSIDLDQVTVRKAQPRLHHDCINNAWNYTESAVSNIARQTTAQTTIVQSLGKYACTVAKDECTQPQTLIKHESGSSPLAHLLSHNDSILPGQRQIIVKASQSEGDSVRTTSQRGVKRIRSEAFSHAANRVAPGTPETSRQRDIDAVLGERSPRSSTRQSRSMIDYSTLSGTHQITPKLDGIRVVRGAARKALHAVDCQCCSDFYRLAGPPPDSAGPVWRSPPRNRQALHVDSTKQVVGRHRSVWRRSPTPPEFWDPDFPTTQQVTKEKRDNQRRRSRKLPSMDESRPRR